MIGYWSMTADMRWNSVASDIVFCSHLAIGFQHSCNHIVA